MKREALDEQGTGAARPAPGATTARTLTFLVAASLFMENLDSTILVTAIPDMAHAFGVRPVDLGIGVSAYVLTLAVLIPASGWMVDRFGGRRVFATAIVVFTLASVLCGLSGSLLTFTLARILQGIGGAMMVPVGRLIVLRSTDKKDLIRAIATLTWPGLAAPVLGPPLGGFITMYFSWHWIFYLNVPLGIAAFCLTLRLMPREKVHSARPFDLVGFLLTGVACFALMYGVELISRQEVPWLMVGSAIALGFGTGAYALVHARRHRSPLVDLWALSVPSYAAAVRGGSMVRVAIHSIPFLLPLLFQVSLGLDPLTSGLFILAVFAGNLVTKVGTTALLRRFPFRTVLVVNGLLNAAMIFACMLITAETPVYLTVPLLFLTGVTRSIQFTAVNTLAFADVPQERMNGANTLSNMAQQMAIGGGVALGALALRFAEFANPRSGPGIPVADFQIAFFIVGLVALAAALDALRLHPGAGEEIRRK